MLEWVLSSAVLCALVILLRYLLRGRISLRLQYALWGLVLLRLLLPVSFGASRMSVQNILPEKALASAPAPVPAIPVPAEETQPGHTAPYTAAGAEVSAYTPAAGEAMTGEASVGEAEAVPPQSRSAVPPDLPRLLRLIWAAGAILAGMWMLYVNLRFALRLRRSREAFAGAGDFSLPVYVTGAAETPCLFGLFRPAVYLPPEAAQDPALDHILAHEHTHFRHGDQVWSLLRGLALALHWFDPLVWWAAVLSRRDGELACDEGTLRRLGEGERTEYGRTLLRMTCSRRTAIFRTATTMTGGKGGLKERIRLIAGKPRTAALTLIAVILIAALALGCTFTGAKTRAEETEEGPYLDGLMGVVLPAARTCAGENALTLSGDLYTQYNAADRSTGVTFETTKDGVFICVSCVQEEDGTWALSGDRPVYLIDRYSGVTLENEAEDAPPGAASIARSYVYTRVYNWNAGYLDQLDLFAGDVSISHRANEELPEANAPEVNRIIRARITGLTPMGAGTAGLTEGRDLYRLEYRLLPEDQENIPLYPGMQTEVIDGETWITEWTEFGQPYLLIGWKDRDGDPDQNREEPLWTLLGVTGTRQLEEVYGTPEMRQKYGNAYLAASVELYAAQMGESGAYVELSREDFTLLRPGDSFRLTVKIAPSLSGEPAEWVSQDPNVAEVSEDGLVTAVDHGATKITVSVGGYSAECVVRVSGYAAESPEPTALPPQVKALTLNREDITLTTGESFRLVPILSEALREAEVTWQSQDPAVAEVSGDGTVTAVDHGSTRITASAGGYSAECIVRVSGYAGAAAGGSSAEGEIAAGAGEIVLDRSVVTLYEGMSFRLAAELAPELAGRKIFWTSEDPDIVSVDQEGVVSAVGWGTTRIHAAAGDSTAECVVMVPGGARLARETDGFPVNGRGETYGGIKVKDGLTLIPDLELAEGFTPEGEKVTGYIRPFEEQNGSPIPHPRTPQEAMAYNAAMEELRREALEAGRNYLYAIPLYAEDGVTVVGSFGVGSTWRSSRLEPTPEPTEETIRLNREDITLSGPGETFRLIAELSPEEAGAEVVWSSESPYVATVDAYGNVQAVGQGSTTVTASAGEAKAECIVRVRSGGNAPAGTEKTYALSHSDITIHSGSGETFLLKVNGAGKEDTLTYSSSATAVAAVDGSGRVSAVSNGTAEITVTVETAEGEQILLTCTVRVVS